MILLDWYMPILDAQEWLKRYTEETSQQIPVYILTSSINPDDKKIAGEFAIVQGFFSKPLQQQHIEQILEKGAGE